MRFGEMVELMPSLRCALERIAERENCSVDELINMAIAEKVAASDAEYLMQRKQAAQGKAKQALHVLARINGNEVPSETDRIPESSSQALS